MSGLIKRLRKNGTDQYDPCGLCDEAADEIERLKTRDAVFLEKITEQDAEIERLQAVVDAAKYIQSCIDRGCHSMETVPDLREALAALEDDK